MEISLPVKQSVQQTVVPQGDGRLRITSPDKQTRYDMGNKALFVTFDGTGSVTRVLQTDGYWAGRWKTDIVIQDRSVNFDAAGAIGRLWELNGRDENKELILSSFLDESSPVVYQCLTINNREDHDSTLRVTLTLSIDPPLSAIERIKDGVVRFFSRFSLFASWWGREGSKKIHPRSPQRLVHVSDGYIGAKGSMHFTWGGDRLPARRKCNKKEGLLEFEAILPKDCTTILTWAVAAGEKAQLETALSNSRVAFEDAHGYASWLNSKYGGDSDDVLLRSLFVAGLNTAVAMFKEFSHQFAGLVAGPDYGYPPRLYFRDGYWTAQILLKTKPDLVRRHLLSLARGVHPDGSCPSGVFVPHILEENPGIQSHDWLPDHYDSPSFFILLLEDYVKVTGDYSVLDEQVDLFLKEGHKNSFSLRDLVYAAARYLISLDSDGDGLIEKPHKANDWADNVRRSVWVTYDQALYVAALYAVIRLAKDYDEEKTIADFCSQAEKAQRAMNELLWDDKSGHFVNYMRDGFVESNFSIDSLIALRYGLVSPEREKRVLEAARSLQTRLNSHQKYGDWGVMCVYPYYKQQRDLFDKSAFPVRYHNGADWPYWDGVYAEILQRCGDADWRYVVSRWWEYSLSQGWLTPPEYYSPPYKPGGMLQGWSAMPATVLLG